MYKSYKGSLCNISKFNIFRFFESSIIELIQNMYKNSNLLFVTLGESGQ